MRLTRRFTESCGCIESLYKVRTKPIPVTTFEMRRNMSLQKQ